MSDPVRVGVIGCGAISGQYLGISKRFPEVQVVACADINPEAARAKAAEFQIPRALSVDELIADPSIELVLNLTIPKAHASISLRALEAGKHTYGEKPLGVTRDEGMAILKKASEKKLLVGCAPDTFMGFGLQTARSAIDRGLIGRPTAFTAFMMNGGHENWHGSPEFFYEVGGGPMMDMGPYYVTALLNLLGPVKSISGAAAIGVPERTITSQPKFGKKIKVETPDHVCGTMVFEGGAVGVIFMSFAAQHAELDRSHPITIFGDKGTLLVPDPNNFDGTVLVKKWEDGKPVEVPPVFSHQYGRSVGLAEMAGAIRHGGDFRANGQQAFAALDLMLGFLDSSNSGKAYTPVTKYQRPAPLPAGNFGAWK